MTSTIQQIDRDLPDELDPNSEWNKNPLEGNLEEVKRIEGECLRGKKYDTFLEAMRYYETLYPEIDCQLIVPAVIWEFNWDDPKIRNKELEEAGRNERNIIFKKYGVSRVKADYDNSLPATASTTTTTADNQPTSPGIDE